MTNLLLLYFIGSFLTLAVGLLIEISDSNSITDIEFIQVIIKLSLLSWVGFIIIISVASYFGIFKCVYDIKRYLRRKKLENKT